MTARFLEKTKRSGFNQIHFSDHTGDRPIQVEPRIEPAEAAAEGSRFVWFVPACPPTTPFLRFSSPYNARSISI
jgi:hypothetical protein